MRVIVCGGRNYDSRKIIRSTLSFLHAAHGFTLVATGAASGADHHAHEWAVDVGIETREFPADWRKHGNSAGIIRNKEMLDAVSPQLVVAFPGGRGTYNMISIANARRVEIYEVLDAYERRLKGQEFPVPEGTVLT